MIKFFRTSLFLLTRNWKSGELKLISFAVLVSVMCITSMVFLTSKIASGIEEKSGALVGSDLKLTSPSPISAAFAKKAKALGLKTTYTIGVFSMVAHDEELTLSEVKGVQSGYPLRGEIRTANTLFGESEVANSIPTDGTIWVEPRLLSLLGADIGDEITVGVKSFKVTRVLVEEPDRIFDVFGAAPMILMSIEDLKTTEIFDPGESNATYKLLISGDQNKIAEYMMWAHPRIEPTHLLAQPKDSNPRIQRILTRSNYYLSLAFIVNITLAGVAIAMAARRFSKRQFSTVALLRCFGAGNAWVFSCYLVMLALLGLIIGSMGIGLGLISGHVLIQQVFTEVFSKPLPDPWLWPSLVGLLSTFILILGFAFPPLLATRKITALRVLRKDLPDPKWSEILPFALPVSLVFVLVFLQVKDFELSSTLIMMAFGVGVFSLVLVYTFIGFLSKLTGWLGFLKKLNIRNVVRRMGDNALQVVAFNLVLTLAGVLFLVQGDLLNLWEKDVAPNIPNYFVLNVVGSQKEAFQEYLKENDVVSNRFYPIVQTRVLSVDGEKVKYGGSFTSGERSVHRLIQVSSSMILDPDNRIINGRWFEASDKGKPLISIEQRFADRLGVKLNSEIELYMGRKTIKAKVISIREVDWHSFKPNFFILLPSGILEKMTPSYMTSFYVPEKELLFSKHLMEKFPMVTLLDVQMIVAKVRSFLLVLSSVVEYLWTFTFLISFVLLFATILSTLDERMREAKLLRILGISNRQLLWIVLSEFVLLGFLAGAIAVVGAHIMAYWLAGRVFGFPYSLNLQFAILLPFVGMVLVSVGGYLGTRRIFTTPPLRLTG